MTDATPQPAAPQPAAPLTEAEDKQWASFAHLGGIISFPPALIIWLVFKARGAFTNTEAKEALNFQITLAIAQVALFIIGSILTVVTLGLFAIVQTLLSFAIWAVGLIFSIIGFTKAKDGEHYRYPFALRLIK
ncbi:DUF4870 domain-containing protein [Salinibacterium sp. M195]|uniref:DUF4870 domain-containing protein n=1 Tax=Salinibacterium sp. M195 TaxID=2583374 RepID=UPI001C63B034|nr:DUF4870 domain-containing protein [Salinibacterium sp. M195]QYH35943.1 DUF4870 domain-containing protein [Salinibacterium sp. M195]